MNVSIKIKRVTGEDLGFGLKIGLIIEEMLSVSGLFFLQNLKINLHLR